MRVPVLLGVAALALGGAYALAACGLAPEAAAEDAAWTYVGDAACASCHADIAASYARSGMGRAVAVFDPATAPERFGPDGRSPLVCAPAGIPGGGYCYEAFVRNDSLVQRETHPDLPGYERTVAASHVVGSGNATRSYLASTGGPGAHAAPGGPGGYLTELPLTWYVERAVWDLSPGYDQANRRFDRPITQECLTCHNGLSEHETSQNFFGHVPLGISCERCHGPASAHVEAFESGDAPGQTFIVNPDDLAPEEQLAVCQQCHLSGQTVFGEGHAPDTFRPGRPLTAHRAVFSTTDALDDPERFGISSHAGRMMRSDCYTASAATARPMTCTTCHDPHTPTAEMPADAFSAACRSCHATPAFGGAAPEPAAPACDRPGATTPALAAAGDCASCHLTRGGTSDIPHVSFTDHWIRERPPAGRTSGPSAADFRRDAPFELIDVVRREAAAAPASRSARALADLDAGEALVGFHDTVHGLPVYLARAAARLRAGLAGGADRTSARVALGRALAGLDSLGASEAVLLDAARRDTSDAHAAFWLGHTRLRLGDDGGAAAAFARAVRQAPRFSEAHFGLAKALAADPAAAADILEAALAQDPTRHAPEWNNLGLHRLAAGDVPRALGALRRAVALDPREAAARTNLGSALLASGDTPAAAAQLEAALRVDPAHVPALGNLGIVRAQQGRTGEARALFARVLALQPGDPRATAYLAELR